MSTGQATGRRQWRRVKGSRQMKMRLGGMVDVVMELVVDRCQLQQTKEESTSNTRTNQRTLEELLKESTRKEV